VELELSDCIADVTARSLASDTPVFATVTVDKINDERRHDMEY
jgi:hypothetical protein